MSETQKRIQEVLDAEALAISKIPITDDYEKALDLIYQTVHEKHGKLVTTGMGKAGQIALNIATTFSSTGTPAVYVHAGEAQHGDLGVIQKNDLLLLVSNSGKTREVIEVLELSRHLYEHLPVVAITGNPESPVSKAANASLVTGNPDEVCPLGLTPTTSTTTMTVIGDLLVVLMMEKIQFTREEYAKRHHGGYLGYKSRLEDPQEGTEGAAEVRGD